jgi:hypothetical protein
VRSLTSRLILMLALVSGLPQARSSRVSAARTRAECGAARSRITAARVPMASLVRPPASSLTSAGIRRHASHSSPSRRAGGDKIRRHTRAPQPRASVRSMRSGRRDFRRELARQSQGRAGGRGNRKPAHRRRWPRRNQRNGPGLRPPPALAARIERIWRAGRTAVVVAQPGPVCI